MSNQPPKDFLALSHGHEWVNFYESFDKLVQDHLSRSSELLRKAMSLPEVADREVAQVRDDLESRLTSERERYHGTLMALKQEITGSHQQAVALAQVVGTMMANLDRLRGTVESALAGAAEGVAGPGGTAGSEPNAGETAYAESAAASAPASEAAQDWVAEVAGEAGRESGESSDETGVPWSDLAEEAQGEPDDEIDLSALAAMEEGSTDGGESSEAESGANGSERVRPHWLSVARTGSTE